MTKDEFYMGKALAEAKTAYAVGEIPIGAVIVYQKKVIARAYNLRESLPVPRPMPSSWPLKKPAAHSIAGA